MVQSAFFQMIIAITGLFFSLLFMSEVNDKGNLLQKKVVGLVFLYTFSMFSLLIPATTRQSYQFLGILIPPLHIWLEAIIMGFMISIAAEVIYQK